MAPRNGERSIRLASISVTGPAADMVCKPSVKHPNERGGRTGVPAEAWNSVGVS